MNTPEEHYDTYKVNTKDIEKIKKLLYIDTYKQGPRAGIINVTNSCWFNATIQMILCMPDFVLSILQTEKTQTNRIGNTIIKQNVFKNFLIKQLLVPLGTLPHNRESISPTKLELQYVISKCISDTNLWSAGTQQDAHEGFSNLLNLFEPVDIKDTDAKFYYNDDNNFYIFDYNTKNYTSLQTVKTNIFQVESDNLKKNINDYINDDMQKNNIDNLDSNNTCKGGAVFANIQLESCDKTLKDFIKKTTNPDCIYLNTKEIAEEVNTYFTNNNIFNESNTKIIQIDTHKYNTYYISKNTTVPNLYNLLYTSRIIYITNINKYFIVHLKLFDFTTSVATKIYTAPPISYKLFIENKTYILSGFIAHSGTTSDGHYVFYKITSDNTGILYNDTYVNKHDEKTNNILKFEKNTKNIFISVINTNHTPYVLLYERDDSNNNDITFNLTFNDVFGDHLLF